MPQTEPLACEVDGESSGLRVVKHPLHLLLEDHRLAELSTCGQLGECVVWRTAPQKVRKPAGQVEVVELAGRGGKVQKVGAAEHRFERDPQRSLDTVALVNAGL